MFEGNTDHFSIYVNMEDIHILTARFSMRITKKEGMIVKEYLNNHKWCFKAEEYLAKIANVFVEWLEYELPAIHNYDVEILSSLLADKLNNDFRNTEVFGRVFESENNKDFTTRPITRITFKGMFRLVRFTEDFLVAGRVIHSTEKTMSKQNAARYLINKGYYIFGDKGEMVDVIEERILTRKQLMEGYLKHTTPIMEYMRPIVEAWQNNRRNLIACAAFDTENPMLYAKGKIYTTQTKSKKNMSLRTIEIYNKKKIRKMEDNLKSRKKTSYWEVINKK